MDVIERRKTPRIDVDYVTVEVYSSHHYGAMPEVSEICTVINLGEEGMRFSTDVKFKPKQVLHLTFFLPDTLCVVRSYAAVVHTISKRGGTYEIGVKFTNLGSTERTLIQHFIKKNLEPETQHSLQNALST